MPLKKQYRYLLFIAMLYMTVKLTTVVLIYKIITIGTITASASTLIMPLWFVLGDIITEVYGYPVARQLIWISLICQFIFAICCSMMITFPSPLGWGHQEAYDQVLGKLPRIAFASFLAIVTGGFINAYVISKWKILVRGKYFWLRSLGASAIGELVFTVVAFSTEFIGMTSFSNVLHLITVSYLTKLIFNPILIIPVMYITAALKKAEGVDAYDLGVNFNPFKISLNEQNPISDNPISNTSGSQI